MLEALPPEIEKSGPQDVAHLVRIYERRLKWVDDGLHDAVLTDLVRGILRALSEARGTGLVWLGWHRGEERYSLWTDPDITRALLWDVWVWHEPRNSRALLVAWGDQSGQRAYVDRSAESQS